MWSACLKLSLDDEPHVRGVLVDVHQRVSPNHPRVCAGVAQEKLLEMMLDHLGFVSPQGFIFTCLGSVLRLLFDRDDGQELVLDVDKAYDKNEVNCYQEVIGHCKLLMCQVRKMMLKLSPKMQQMTLKTNLPPDLIRNIVPEFPGAVMVYNLDQLVDYIIVRLNSNVDVIEFGVLTLILSSLRSPILKNQLDKIKTCEKT